MRGPLPNPSPRERERGPNLCRPKKSPSPLMGEGRVRVTKKRAAGNAAVHFPPRYEGDRIADIAKGRDVTAGVSIVPPGKPDDAARYAMIGAVFLKDYEGKFRRKH